MIASAVIGVGYPVFVEWASGHGSAERALEIVSIAPVVAMALLCLALGLRARRAPAPPKRGDT